MVPAQSPRGRIAGPLARRSRAASEAASPNGANRPPARPKSFKPGYGAGRAKAAKRRRGQGDRPRGPKPEWRDSAPGDRPAGAKPAWQPASARKPLDPGAAVTPRRATRGGGLERSTAGRSPTGPETGWRDALTGDRPGGAKPAWNDRAREIARVDRTEWRDREPNLTGKSVPAVRPETIQAGLPRAAPPASPKSRSDEGGKPRSGEGGKPEWTRSRPQGDRPRDRNRSGATGTRVNSRAAPSGVARAPARAQARSDRGGTSRSDEGGPPRPDVRDQKVGSRRDRPAVHTAQDQKKGAANGGRAGSTRIRAILQGAPRREAPRATRTSAPRPHQSQTCARQSRAAPKAEEEGRGVIAHNRAACNRAPI